MAQKSDEQIRREFAARPGYEQLAIAAGDLTNRALNGFSGGLVNKGIQRLTGDTDAERIAAEREIAVRSGEVGDIAGIGGAVYGGGKLISGFNHALKALKGGKAALTAGGSLLGRQGLAGRFGAGLGRAAGPVAPGARTSLALKGIAVGAIGTNELARGADNTITKTDQSKAATTQKAAAKPVVAAVKAPPTFEDKRMALLDKMISGKHVNGLDLQQATELAPAPLKPSNPLATAKAVALGEAAKRAVALSDLQARAMAGDPKIGAKMLEAAEKDFNRWNALAGMNANDLAQAQMMAGIEDGN
jgi:hypothetical protein